MPSPSDSELTARVRDGSEEAFRDLFYRYRSALHGFVHRRLGNDAWASDVVQDVFVRVWENRARLDPSQSVRALLYRSAGNLVIDQFRHAAVKQRHESGVEPGSTQPMAGYLFLESEVKKALDAMPVGQREAFVLSRYDGLTYAEIARILTISVKAVEKRMSLALRHLRQALADFLVVTWVAIAAALAGGG